MIDVETLIEDDRWLALDLETLAARAAKAALSEAGIDQDAEISLLACDDARIAALNTAFRGKDGATNVLSWPSVDLSPDTPGDVPSTPDHHELGDIAIAYETCAKESAAAGKPMADHTTHLIIHAVLHLIGYDHETDKDATLMEQLEITTLATLGIENPYS